MRRHVVLLGRRRAGRAAERAAAPGLVDFFVDGRFPWAMELVEYDWIRTAGVAPGLERVLRPALVMVGAGAGLVAGLAVAMAGARAASIASVGRIAGRTAGPEPCRDRVVRGLLGRARNGVHDLIARVAV